MVAVSNASILSNPHFLTEVSARIANLYSIWVLHIVLQSPEGLPKQGLRDMSI